jgi:hypothetical protein
MPIIDNTYSMKAGVIDHLKSTWDNQAPIFKTTQEICIKFLPAQNLRKATYAWKDSVPFPSRWAYSAGRTYRTFKDRYIDISNTAYEISIPYNKYDEEDDQLGDVKSHISLATRRFLQLPDKFLGEYLNNSADLLPALANAFDGVALFSDVDGNGDARFNTTGGNIVTGSGTATTAAVKHDLMVAQRRFLRFRDTAGEIIFGEDDVKFENLHVIVPTAMNGVIQELSKAQYLHMDVASNTSESNIVMQTFSSNINPYLSDDVDWYVAVKHPYWRGLAYRAPQDVRQIIAEFSNSDHARKYNEECLYADVRCGMGVWAPWVIIKVNN